MNAEVRFDLVKSIKQRLTVTTKFDRQLRECESGAQAVLVRNQRIDRET